MTIYERIDPYLYENVMRLSRLAHIKRYKKAAEFVNKGDLVLDAGCGYGYGSKLLAKYASNVIGIDKCSDAISYASEIYGGKSIQFFAGNLEIFDLSCFGLFDVIAFIEVIEHLKKPGVVLKKFRDQINPKGVLLLSVPIWRNLSNINQHHVRDYTQYEIEELLNKNGYKVEEVLVQYPLLGALAEFLRKSIGYDFNTDKGSGFFPILSDMVPLVSDFFSGIYKSGIAPNAAGDLYFIARARS